MPLTLYVDADRWRARQHDTRAAYPHLVPVAKGTGYGFGTRLLAAEAARLGVPTLAVGTAFELPDAAPAFPGDLLVLAPWRPGDDSAGLVAAAGADRVVRTVSRVADVAELATAGAPAGRPVRAVVELRTSLRRHGVPRDELPALLAALAATPGLSCEGFTVHLPLPAVGPHAREVADVLRRLDAVGAWASVATRQLLVSHLSPAEVTVLAAEHDDVAIRARIGTRLWLADRTTYRSRASVLDVHRLRRGERFGYRSRRAAAGGHLLVVAGGTAHGVALEAPTHGARPADRARTLAAGALEAAGLALSPFVVAGHRRFFAEPPHMLESLVFLPGSVPPPAVGAELDVNVGMTITRFDRVVLAPGHG